MRRVAVMIAFLAALHGVCPFLAKATNAVGLDGDALDKAAVVRLIGSAESAYFHAAARYATFAELVQSGQLARTAEQSPAYSHALQLLNLQSDSEPISGFVLGLIVTSDGMGYQFSLKSAGGACLPAWFTDQTGILYAGKALDCNVAVATPVPAPRGWSPEDIDAVVPPVSHDTPCPLDEVLHKSSQQALQLVDNLQRFSARESIEHIEFRKDGKKRNSSAESLDYVAQIQQNGQALWVDEYRTGEKRTESDQPLLTDTGTAAFALIFHPRLVGNFDIRCEGKADVPGGPAWQVRFEESADPKKSFHQIRIKNSIYPLRFKGRAWIATDNFEILRLQTDLIAPIPQIDLQVEHLDISYGPVSFEKGKLQVWLPEKASLYIAYHGHRYARLHNFDRFQLFTISTEQTTKSPTANSGANSK